MSFLEMDASDAPEMALPEPALCMEGLWIALLLFAARIAISQ